MRPTILPVYLDHHATTPAAAEVCHVMHQVFTETVGNPHSGHLHGSRAQSVVEKSIGQIADLIGAQSREIVLTPGATYANNLALLGLAHLQSTGRNRIVTAKTEHPCVLETARHMAAELGFEVTELAVDREGFLDLQVLRQSLDKRVALVSIMLGNNEIGVLQPLKEIALLAHEVGALVHTDAAQVVGKLSVDVDQINVDLMSISGHKMNGPMGIGALFVRDGVPLRAIVHGGRQQAFQSGTLPTPLCAGLGMACSIAASRLEVEGKEIGKMRDALFKRISTELPSIQINGPLDFSKRLPGNLNIFIPGLDVQEFITLLAPTVSVSAGAACASSKSYFSHVIDALGHHPDRSKNSIRIGIGRTNSIEEINFSALEIVRVAKLLNADLLTAK